MVPRNALLEKVASSFWGIHNYHKFWNHDAFGIVEKAKTY